MWQIFNWHAHLRDRKKLPFERHSVQVDRKSTRLNSSHGYISYAVFCLKKQHQYERHRGGGYGDPGCDLERAAHTRLTAAVPNRPEGRISSTPRMTASAAACRRSVPIHET